MIYLERHDDAENIHRFYLVDKICDLFGVWVLKRRFGRVGAGPGRGIQQSFTTEVEAAAAAASIAQQKRKRGYKPA